MKSPYDASGARQHPIDEQNDKARRRSCSAQSVGSLGYRFTFKKGSTEGEEQLAALRAMISKENKSVRNGRKYWPEECGRYPRSEKRVCVKGRCGKGNYNRRTMQAHVRHDEASRFDVYVLNK